MTPITRLVPLVLAALGVLEPVDEIAELDAAASPVSDEMPGGGMAEDRGHERAAR